MKRQISIVALIAAALIACQAVSAEAKPTRAPSHKPTTKGVKVPTGNIDPGYGVKPGQLKTGSGFNINNVSGAPAFPTQTGFGNRPIGHGPVLPPKSTPVTWGGNPPRAPVTGCGDKSGCHHGDYCGHDYHRCHDRMWWSQICFAEMFDGYYGACDDCYGECDFYFCQ